MIDGITSLSQFILHIAQLIKQVAEDLCQHHLVMEHLNQSKVWKHSTQGDSDNSATCTHCSNATSCQGSSASGLFRHLKSNHKLSLESEEDQPCSSKKTKI